MNMIRALKILSKDTGRRENSAKPKLKRAYYVAPKRTRIADLPILLRLGLVVAAVLLVFFIIKVILTPVSMW